MKPDRAKIVEEKSILRRLIHEQTVTRTRDDFVWALATQSASEETLAAQAPISAMDGTYSTTLPAQSVTSFVGTVTPVSP